MMKRKEDDPVILWDAALVKGVENCKTLHECLTIIQSGDKSTWPSYTFDELTEKMEHLIEYDPTFTITQT